ARDRLGKKPLYYHLGQKRLSFGSEVKSLLCDPAVPRELDEEALDLYLSLRYVPAGLTAFARIHKLPPAACATYENGKLSVRRYWRTVFPPEPDLRSDDELAADFWERLRHAVKIRLMSDVPLYYLSKRTREEVVVVLSGEGADEVLAGYPIYRTMLYLERVRQAAAGAVDRTAPLAARAVKNPKVRKYLYWATLPLEERYRG